jgi:Zn-dependent protease with chaperone function
MHSSFLFLTVLMAGVWRWQWRSAPDHRWTTRWQSTLSTFCLPPLMVLLATGAVLSMGHHGRMMGGAVSPVGCWISFGILAVAGGGVALTLGRLTQTHLRLRQYALVTLPSGGQARCLEIDLPVAAQVGLWQSSLLVSRGWLDQLTDAEQQAMVAHEQAHADYHDPLWFLGLAMVRRFTGWLPQTQALWEELLLLREMRADRRAATTSDPLLLAELLIKLSRQMTLATQGQRPHLESCLEFNEALSLCRLEQRVNAVLAPDVGAAPAALSLLSLLRRLLWLMVAVLPLAAPWLHT